MLNNLFYNPLEQFELNFMFSWSLQLTNVSFFLLCLSIVSLFFFSCLVSYSPKIYLLSFWTSLFQKNLMFIFSIFSQLYSKATSALFSLYMFFYLWIILLFFNLSGLISFSVSLTSQLVLTLYLSVMVLGTLLGYMIWSEKSMFFNRFLPIKMNFFLNILLIPLEVLSFFARFVSLSVRLFANMMAGHLLLKIFLMFISMIGFTLMNMFGSLIAAICLSFLILLIFCLELGIAVLQAYVFITLCMIYFTEAIDSSH